MIETIQDQRTRNRLELHSFVVMPDHLHLMLTPAFDVSLEKAMQYIKGGLSFRLKSKLDVWERSYDSRWIRSWEDFEEPVRYIHQNPVRAGLTAQPDAYPFSSAGRPQLVDPQPHAFRFANGRG